MIWRQLMVALAGADAPEPRALERIGSLAHAFGAELELFDSLAHEDGLGPEAAAGAEAIRDRVEARRRRVEQSADRLRDRHLKARSSVHWDAPPDEAAVRQVLREHPDLLVTAAGRLQGEPVLSPAQWRLALLCPCPALLLQRFGAGAGEPVLAALTLTSQADSLDESVLATAVTLAQGLGDCAVLVYAGLAPSQEAFARAGAPEPRRDAAGDQSRLAAARVQARRLAALHSVRAEQVHVELASLDSALPYEARQRHAQALVVGCPSPACSTELLRALDCDVLIVKPEDYHTPVSRHPWRPQ